MVSAALRVTEIPGSCTIQSDWYDVNEGANGEDNSELDVAGIMARKTRRVRCRSKAPSYY